MSITAPPAQPQQQPQPSTSTNHGLGLAALIIGAVAFVLGLIPFVGYGSWVLAVLAIIFGLVAVTRRNRKKLLGLIGLVLGVVALILGFVISIGATAAVVSSVGQSVNKVTTHTIVYDVTGDGKNASVTYDQYQDNKDSSVTKNEKLPFTKTFTFKEKGIDVGSYSVTADYNLNDAGNFEGKTMKCSVTVDGKVVSTDSAKGSSGLVACDGTAG